MWEGDVLVELELDQLDQMDPDWLDVVESEVEEGGGTLAQPSLGWWG